MLILATAFPSFALEGDRVVLTVPSGKDKLEIALTSDQLFFLDGATRNTIINLLEANKERLPKPTAEIIAMPKRRRAGRRSNG